MSDDLKARLRDGIITGMVPDFSFNGEPDWDATESLMIGAANRIEALEAEVARLPSWDEYQKLMSAGYKMKARAEKAEANLEHWRQEVGKLHSKVDRLTQERDAASAAAYEAAGETAAEFIHRRLYEANMPVCSYHSRDIKTAIRALATPNQLSALERVRAEAKAEGMRAALEFVTDFPLGADGPEDGNDRVVWALENIRNAILAAIPKQEQRHD